MAIEFACPHCHRKLRVSDDTAGRRARCPGCSQVTKIPAVTAGPLADIPAPSPPPLASGTPDPTLSPAGRGTPGSENPFAPPGLSTQIDRLGADPFQRSPLASRGRRLLGAIVDGLVRIGIMALGLLVPLLLYGATGGQVNEDLLVGLVIALAAIGAIAGAGINWYLITISGQSIAKRWLGMRIVKADDESLPGFLNGVLLRMWVPFLINQACGMFSLVDVLFIFGENQRCVHDLIASTNVIDVETERQSYPSPGSDL